MDALNRFNMSWKQLKDTTPVIRTEIQELAIRLEEKRKKALEYLGADHVLHPNYQQKKRHSPLIDVWKEDGGVLFDVRHRATIAGRI
jgi:hypothetical protein